MAFGTGNGFTCGCFPSSRFAGLTYVGEMTKAGSHCFSRFGIAAPNARSAAESAAMLDAASAPALDAAAAEAGNFGALAASVLDGITSN